MKVFAGCSLAAAFLCLTATTVTAARDADHVSKSFPATKLVRLDTDMGSCEIKVGAADSIRVDLEYEIEGKGYYEPDMEFDGDELILSDEVSCRNCSISATWTITIPAKTEVHFETASGSLDVSGTSSRVDANIASGDVSLTDCQGPIEVKTASGNIEISRFTGALFASTASGSVEIRDSKGEFDLRSASGDVKAMAVDGRVEISVASGDIRAGALSGEISLSTASGNLRATDIRIEKASSFNSASGDATVSLAASPASDLSVKSASGDAHLLFNGNPVQGHFEFTALADDGNISAPFKFDSEREFRRHGQDYIRKSFTLGTGGPEITIGTGSGEAALEK